MYIKFQSTTILLSTVTSSLMFAGSVHAHPLSSRSTVTHLHRRAVCPRPSYADKLDFPSNMHQVPLSTLSSDDRVLVSIWNDLYNHIVKCNINNQPLETPPWTTGEVECAEGVKSLKKFYPNMDSSWKWRVCVYNRWGREQLEYEPDEFDKALEEKEKDMLVKEKSMSEVELQDFRKSQEDVVRQELEKDADEQEVNKDAEMIKQDKEEEEKKEESDNGDGDKQAKESADSDEDFDIQRRPTVNLSKSQQFPSPNRWRKNGP